MNKADRQPAIGDEVIVVRCDDNPAMVGETAEVDRAEADGFFHVKVIDSGGLVGPGDYILRRK